MRKKIIQAVVSALIMVLLLGSMGYYFLPNTKVIQAYPGKVTSLVIEGDLIVTPDPPVFESSQVLLPIRVIERYFDETILWDEKRHKVIITTSDKFIKMNTDKLTAYINNKSTQLSVAPRIIGGAVYLPIDFLKDTYKIDVGFNKENNVVIVDYRDSLKRVTNVVDNEVCVRCQMSIRSPIVEKLGQGDFLRIFDEFEKWYKVRTENGTVGYILKKSVAAPVLTSSTYTEETKAPAEDEFKGKLSIVWDPDYSNTLSVEEGAKIEGLDVVSPTWFQLSGDNGDITSKASLRYVEWAKKNGYKVWALFSNDFATESRPITSKILNDSELREKIIRQLLVLAKLYKLDGINVDFENMYEKDKYIYSQFIRELAPFMREQGLTISVDVGVPGGSEYYSLCYDRKSLAKAADYIMLMTYDQHWKSSPVSGSVAQYSWVERMLQRTLKEVPADKLLLGMPFYTRVWKERIGADGKLIGRPESSVLTMEKAREYVKQNSAKVTWDQESGQFYAEYTKGGVVYKVWIEDDNSINLKSSLVHKYGLAGAVAWRKGFETKNIWSVLNTNLKEKQSYTEWIQANSNLSYMFD